MYLGLHSGGWKAVYEEEQRGYYILSSFWAELDKDQVLGEPAVVRTFDMHTCTLEDVQVRKLLALLSLFHPGARQQEHAMPRLYSTL